MTTQPPTDEQLADGTRCASSHWSLPLACALPRTHRDNWHSGWVVLAGERRYVRYRRTVGATEQLETDGWKPLDIPGPRQEPTREQLLAEVDRLRSLLVDRDRRIELVQQHLAAVDSRTVHPDAIALGLDLLPLLDGVLHPSHHTDTTRES